MIELRLTEAAARSIVEQADYYERAAEIGLARRWEIAVDEAIGSLLRFPERGARCRIPLSLRNCAGFLFPASKSI